MYQFMATYVVNNHRKELSKKLVFQISNFESASLILNLRKHSSNYFIAWFTFCLVFRFSTSRYGSLTILIPCKSSVGASAKCVGIVQTSAYYFLNTRREH